MLWRGTTNVSVSARRPPRSPAKAWGPGEAAEVLRTGGGRPGVQAGGREPGVS